MTDIIPILDNSIPISDHLRSLIWKNEVPYKPYIMKNPELFENLIKIIDFTKQQHLGEYIAFFAAKYHTITRDVWQNNYNTGNFEQKFYKSLCKNLYFYNDFSVIILKDGKFIDAAIHGVYSNVNRVIEKYNPKVVFCLGTTDSALSTFMNYPYQPFYQSLYHRIVYVSGHVQDTIGKILFCIQNKMFCSFCRCIDTIVTYYKRLRISAILPLQILNTKQNQNNTVQTLRQIIDSRHQERIQKYKNSSVERVQYRFINRTAVKRLQHVKKYKRFYKHN